MKTMKPLLAAAFVASAFVPTSARAENPPTLSAVPEVRLPEMLHPKDSPASLPATETIEGIRVSTGNHRDFRTVESLDGRCITMGALAPGAVPSGNSSVMIRPSSSALPMRVEKFVGSDAGKPELVITDAWVDVASTGIHEERTTHVPLTVLGRGPANYVIYGFRSGGNLHVVFPTPQRFVYVDTYGKLGFVSCQHTRLMLDPAASSASLVRVAGTIESPRIASKGLASNARAGAQPMTLRAIEATVSLSRIKRDNTPLLSVTATWSEDEPPMPLMPNNPVDFQAMPVEDDLGSIHEE